MTPHFLRSSSFHFGGQPSGPGHIVAMPGCILGVGTKPVSLLRKLEGIQAVIVDPWALFQSQVDHRAFGKRRIGRKNNAKAASMRRLQELLLEHLNGTRRNTAIRSGTASLTRRPPSPRAAILSQCELPGAQARLDAVSAKPGG
jgi:hypothetical protein